VRLANGTMALVFREVPFLEVPLLARRQGDLFVEAG
jgi:hypothetical protein